MEKPTRPKKPQPEKPEKPGTLVYNFYYPLENYDTQEITFYNGDDLPQEPWEMEDEDSDDREEAENRKAAFG